MGDIQIRVYSDKYRDRWDEFVDNSRNGTIFHTRSFLSYHPEGRFKDRSLLFLQDGNIVSILPGCLIENNSGLTLASHQGSTYGGFVIPQKLGVAKALQLVDLLLEFMKKEGICDIWMRYPEYIFEKEPSEEIKYAMWHRGFGMDYIELSTCYDLSIYPTESPISWEAKKGYERGVSCIYDDNNYQAFHSLLFETLTSKYNRTPTHTLEELNNLRNLLGKRLVLFSAYYKEYFAGGMIVFLTNEKTAHVFYSAVKKDLIKGIYVSDTLIDYTIRTLKKRGVQFINYGISTEEKGRTINFNLFRFKERFKGFGVVRETWKLAL